MKSLKAYCRELREKMVHDPLPPEDVAAGWALGMFVGCAIPFGLQLVVSVPLALMMRVSKVGATVGTLITNPVTIFFIYPAQTLPCSRTSTVSQSRSVKIRCETRICVTPETCFLSAFRMFSSVSVSTADKESSKTMTGVFRVKNTAMNKFFCFLTMFSALLKKIVSEGKVEGFILNSFRILKVRAIGISNFLEGDVKNILAACRVKPMVNQLLAHITNTPFSLIDYCKGQDILVEAYSPIAHGEALKNPAITDMAKKYGATAAQLCIKYVLQLGLVALPKTASPAHMKENAELGFTISEEDMDVLKGLEHIKDYGDSSFFPVFGGKM